MRIPLPRLAPALLVALACLTPAALASPILFDTWDEGYTTVAEASTRPYVPAVVCTPNQIACVNPPPDLVWQDVRVTTYVIRVNGYADLHEGELTSLPPTTVPAPFFGGGVTLCAAPGACPVPVVDPEYDVNVNRLHVYVLAGSQHVNACAGWSWMYTGHCYGWTLARLFLFGNCVDTDATTPAACH